MLFNSLEFLIFFPLVTLLYFALPLRGRWILLLVASSIFYMAFIPKYVVIIYATIVIDYVAGIYIERSTGARRKAFLVMSLCANIGVLAAFKYCNFLIENVDLLARMLGLGMPLRPLDVVLPIGLSFHTFQAMSYTIEVYRGRQPAERNFIVYALYVMFYPQLVAGPIERPQNIIHQFYVEHPFDPDRVERGLKRMLWGMFKKVVVADRLAVIVGAVYAAPRVQPGPALVLATVCFAFQIYADFSGYSDIAIGAADVMGIDLMTNFRQPYVSRTVSEFWSRWHISLSSWFRDYLYIPLGGNRVGPVRRRLNLLFTFLVSGLWHGASWTFVIWGGLNGLFLIVESLLLDTRSRTVRPSRWGMVRTFALVTVAWVFFRAQSVTDGWHIVRHLGSDWGTLRSASAVRTLLAGAGTDPSHLAIALVGLAVMCAADAWAARHDSDVVTLADRTGSIRRWVTYYGVALGVTFLGIFGRQQFIYFQF
jgi:alginate O-acetyltransferase complex protein AlgI